MTTKVESQQAVQKIINKMETDLCMLTWMSQEIQDKKVDQHINAIKVAVLNAKKELN